MGNIGFWRYFWLNCRYFILGLMVAGVIFSTAWSYQDGKLNIWPLIIFSIPIPLMLIGTIIEYRRYKRTNK